jgi:hypothetical protein
MAERPGLGAWKLSAPEKDDIVRLYVDERFSTRTLGAMFGVHPATIRGLLKRRNIPRRPRGGAIRKLP